MFADDDVKFDESLKKCIKNSYWMVH